MFNVNSLKIVALIHNSVSVKEFLVSPLLIFSQCVQCNVINMEHVVVVKGLHTLMKEIDSLISLIVCLNYALNCV